MSRWQWVLLWLVVAAPVVAADPDWMVRAEALSAKGSPKAAMALLAALPLSVRQTPDYHWELARVAQAAGDVDQAAEAHRLLTLLLPGCSRSLSPVSNWLQIQARRLFDQAMGEPKARRPAAATLYGRAVKADSSLLAAPDRGLGELAVEGARAAAEARPAQPELARELGWQLYLQGRLTGARRAFDSCRSLTPDSLSKWKCQLWLDRIGREQAADRQQEQDRAQRQARERVEDDRRREAADRENEARRKREREESDRADRAAAEARRREIDRRVRELDGEIQTVRERQMLPLRQPGVDPRMLYDVFQELKQQEASLRERKRQLLEEREGLASP
jgi:hypothetical protein